MNKTPLRLLLFAAFLLIFPWFLKRRCRVVRRVLIHKTPSEIFPLINDLRNWPRWTEWSRREEMHFAYEGEPGGVGAVQRWTSRKMEGAMRITQSVPNERIAYDLEVVQCDCHAEGALALEPVGEYTRVTWLCKWQGNPNPYVRYVDLAFMWWIGRDFERGLANLRELAEHEPMPQPVA